MRRQSAIVKFHMSNPLVRNGFFTWTVCFFRQFGSSVVRADYLTLRKAFIMNHNLSSKYDFHSYMIRSMEEEFQRIVGLSFPLWGFVVAFMLFNVKGSNLYFWIAVVPITLVLLLGTKLQHVIATLALESAGITGSEKPFSVIDEFNNRRKQPDLAEAVAAIRALASVIRSSEATTMMELQKELKTASDSLKSWDTTSISLTAGCDLFMRYVTRTSAVEYEDFNAAKSRFLERAEKFGEISYKARKIIAMLGQDFIFNGCTILVHGFSRVVLKILKTAAESKKVFRVLCTEGRPDRTGLRFSNELAKLDVPVKLLIDSAVAYSMDEVDMVIVGADGVVESGGIINMMGTYQIALVAKCMDKPVYVAAESYKFARLYPLDQKDMVPALRGVDFGVPIPSKVEVETSARDYTPPQYLTLLFTDLGVLTPSVVSDELIQLYL